MNNYGEKIKEKVNELKKLEAELEEIKESEPFNLENNIEQIKRLKRCMELTKEIEQELLTILTIEEADKIIREKFNKS